MKSKFTPPPTSQITLAEWENHFDTLYNTSGTNLVAISLNSNAGNHDYAFSNWNCPEELNEDIKLYEIVSELHCTPNGKAKGPDRITYESLKQGFGILFSHILAIFNPVL